MNESRLEIIEQLKADKNIAVEFLIGYPAYFQKQLENVLQSPMI